MAKKSKAVDVHKIAAGKKNKKTHQHSDALVPREPGDDEAAAAAPAATGEETQTPLIPDAEIPVREVVAVDNDRMVAMFVAPHFDTDKNGERTLALEFSFPIVDAHKGRVPENVEEAYLYVLTGKAKRIDVKQIDAQTVNVYDTPKTKKPILHLVESSVTRSVVAEKEESGKGKTRVVVRFSFWLAVDFPNHKWAVEHYGQEFWLTMVDTQAHLLKK